MIECETGAKFVSRAYNQFGLGSGPIFLDHLSCAGDELNIAACPRDVLGLTQCDHSMDIGVQCFGGWHSNLTGCSLSSISMNYR